MSHLKPYEATNVTSNEQMAPANFSAVPVLICKEENTLTIKAADSGPLPENLIKALTHDLCYSHVEAIKGPAKRNPITGQKMFFQTKEYKLHRVTNGHIVVLMGYLARMVRRLNKLGCSVQIIDTKPQRKRPSCYTPQWDNLNGRITFRPRQEECLRTIAKAPCGIIKAVTGFGKAQPVNESVYTPSGPVPIGTLTVGDLIIGSSGNPTEVTGVYPQGVKPVVEVEFSDGVRVRCCREHLWTVCPANQREYESADITVPIEKLIDDLQDNDGLPKWFVPATSAVNFNARSKCPLPPYAFGVLVGSGHRPGIPVRYKYASFEQRMALLRGIMDAAGRLCNDKIRSEFRTAVSKKIALDVCDLVRSLGGITRVEGKSQYRVIVDLELNPFLRHPDSKKWRGYFQPRKTKAIVAIRSIADEPCVCISVAAPNGLYLTTGYTVTHNTTLVGAAALLFPEARIDVVTKSVDVAERIVRSLRRLLPTVGRIGDGYKQRERVTVITAGSLNHADGDVDFLFADEVHQLATINFSSLLANRYRNSRNFGMSATPYARMDNAHAVLEPLFGPMIFDMPYQQAVELGLVVPVRVNWLPIRLLHNPAERYNNRVARKRHGIWTNYDRNRIIAHAVRQYPDTHQILILVETIEHAVHLGKHLPEFTLMYSNMSSQDYFAYKRQKLLPENYTTLTDYQKHELRSQFEAGTLRRVIATDVWSTGVDFEQLNVLVRADDRDSDIVDVQGPGRVSRIYTSPDGAKKEFGEVLDCMDTFDPTFYRKSVGRRNSYKLLGWEQNWNEAQRSWRTE